MGRFSELRHLRQAFTQNAVVGLVLFLAVGIYLAVIGLGAGGGKITSAYVSDVSNSTLYAVFVFAGLMGGSVCNTLGSRWTIIIGAVGYPFYVAGLFYYD